LLGPLTKVFRARIALRLVSQAWRANNVVFISKPGKNDHINPYPANVENMVSS